MDGDGEGRRRKRTGGVYLRQSKESSGTGKGCMTERAVGVEDKDRARGQMETGPFKHGAYPE